MNNIGQIQAQIMSFEKETEEEPSKMAKHSGINFGFIMGILLNLIKLM